MDDFFNKSKYLQADIDQLLKDEIEESLKLDYKESRALAKTDRKKKDISKDVSAFANSDGGLIIYGITEQNHKPTALSFINGNDITKEWLEQVIQSTIFRKIEGLHIIPIRYDNDFNKSIYIVKIPNDSAVPHMASDNRFYRRYNFNSVPMEEYEIRNLYFKQEKTILKLAPPEISISPSGSHRLGKISELNLTMVFHIDNQGNTIEKLYKLEVALPRLLYIYGRGTYDPLKDIHIRDENGYSIFSFPNQSPLFQNERTTFSVNLKIISKSFETAETQPVKLKMYYTGGIEESEIDLKPYLTHQDRLLTIDDLYNE